MNSIVVDHLSKSFDKGKVKALDDISFQVKSGELFGLIGPDGAGKTTLFRILTTLLLPDQGEASIGGKDVVQGFKSIRSMVGYMPGRFSLYQDLTVEENLNFFASIFNTTVEANYNLIKDIYSQLEPFKDRRAGKLSGGMKQKLALCCALIHHPKYLFLDEPTTGVDSVSRKEFWAMIKKLKVEGITILVSTPYMDEANLCERIALLQDGQILSIDTPKGIVSQYPEDIYSVTSFNISKLLSDLRQDPKIKSVYSFGDALHITYKPAFKGDPMNPNNLQTTSREGLEIKKISAGIEDCFIYLMTQN